MAERKSARQVFFVISSLSDFFLDDDGNDDDDDDDVDDDITTQIWTFFRQILISRHFLIQSMDGERSREVPTTLWLDFFSVCPMLPNETFFAIIVANVAK